jgi:hypothetical protein
VIATDPAASSLVAEIEQSVYGPTADERVFDRA